MIKKKKKASLSDHGLHFNCSGSSGHICHKDTYHYNYLKEEERRKRMKLMKERNLATTGICHPTKGTYHITVYNNGPISLSYSFSVAIDGINNTY